MNFLKDVTKGLDNTNLLSEGGNSSEYSGTIDTGSYILNAAISGSIYGGVPNNKITAFAGESATGKTFFVLGVLKRFLDDNPTGGVIYFDTEAAVTKDMMETRGIDTKRVAISEPSSIEEFRTNATRILTTYLDSDEKPPMMMAAKMIVTGMRPVWNGSPKPLTIRISIFAQRAGIPLITAACAKIRTTTPPSAAVSPPAHLFMIRLALSPNAFVPR